jgi:FemAB-related protein (PEP-CTERM system-associated)
MKVRIISNNENETWDNFVLSHGDAGPYHLFAWKRAIEEIYHHNTFYLISENEEADICGALPLVLVKPPLMPATLVSLPFCDYGGVLANQEDIRLDLLKYAYELARSLNAQFEIRNTSPEPLLVESFELEVVSHKVRMIIDLPENSDTLWNSFRSKLRSQIKRPQKDGLIFRLGSIELINDFYTVFRINMRDLGSPVHSKAWIASMIESYGTNAHIGVVFKDRLPLAAGIIFEFRDTVSMPWASALGEFSKLSPNMLLYWGFLEFACDYSFKKFDFGRSTPGEGTFKFKEQWGAMPYPLYWYGRGLTQDDDKMVRKEEIRKLIEKTWARLPQRLVDSVGPMLRKYITL